MRENSVILFEQVRDPSDVDSEEEFWEKGEGDTCWKKVEVLTGIDCGKLFGN